MEQNKQQTAVDWLFDTMLKPLSEWPTDIWQQAKQMEKEQIKQAFSKGQEKESIMGFYDRGEKYYNETYGK